MKPYHFLVMMSLLAAALLLGACDKDDDDGGTPYNGIQINANNLSGPGTSLNYATVHCGGSCSFDNGASGYDQTWIFPEFDWTYESTIWCVEPDETPFASDFPTADRAWAETDYGYTAYIFESITSSGCYQLGWAYEYEQLVFPSPMRTMRFPLRVGTFWTTSLHEVESHEGLDSTYWLNKYTYSADAWGTVITPYDTVTCVRVMLHTEYFYHEAGEETVLDDERYTFTWFDQQGNVVVKTIGPMGLDLDPDFQTGTLLMQIPPYVDSNNGSHEERGVPGNNSSLLRLLSVPTREVAAR